ncbi:MAG TPA: DUF2283 domain-containing protein [Chloroflexota bacterium]|nr:DUF2283 domain-containing protein [Chloroflexota bacterium]HUM70862.1 DUF2283 domain-containing protein [Chloroflexota bacterium]
MQIDYDPQADALYIHFRPGNVDDTQEVNKYIYVDVDENGLPLGLEILFASRVLANEELTSVTFNIGHPTPAVP